MEKVRVGIAGLDHWYAGLGAIRQLKDHPDAELVLVSHRDLEHARPAIEEAGATATSDYDEVVERDDLDLIITACTTAENARLCCKAARSGKHIISVKPFAMNMEEAKEVAVAVKEGGALFMGFECMVRVGEAGVYRRWVREGRIGEPISASRPDEGHASDPGLARGPRQDVVAGPRQGVRGRLGRPRYIPGGRAAFHIRFRGYKDKRGGG